MKVQRVYAKPDGWSPIRNVKGEDGNLTDESKAEGECLNPPPLIALDVIHSGIAAEQNFSIKFVEEGLASGVVSISRGKLTIHGSAEDYEYDILNRPGHYCCHCGASIPDANQMMDGGTRGQLHVLSFHKGKDSPDQSNPLGYKRINHYEVRLNATQHDRLRLKKGGV